MPASRLRALLLACCLLGAGGHRPPSYRLAEWSGSSAVRERQESGEEQCASRHNSAPRAASASMLGVWTPG